MPDDAAVLTLRLASSRWRRAEGLPLSSEPADVDVLVATEADDMLAEVFPSPPAVKPATLVAVRGRQVPTTRSGIQLLSTRHD